MKYFDDPDFDIQQVFRRIDELVERYTSSDQATGVKWFPLRSLPPSRVYKYTSASNAEKILSNCSLRYTQSEVLDDIFEEAPCRDEIRRAMPEYEDGPTLLVDVTDPEERLITFDRVKNARDAMRRAGVVLSDDIPIISYAGLDRGWNYLAGNRLLKYAMEEIRKPLAFSVSALGNNEKLWSMYGDVHRGVCFEFNTRSPYFRSNRDYIDRSGYFAPIEYRSLTAEDFAYRFPYERFFIKTRKWEEQSEWRRIEFLQKEPDVDWQNKCYFFPFPPNILRSVIFGARCPSETYRSLIELIGVRPNLAHVKCLRTRLSVGALIVEKM